MKESLIDIGANLTDASFSQDIESVINRAQKNNISHIIVTGTSVHETRRALDLVSQYPNYLSATAGVHPHAVDATSTSWFEDLTLLARDSKVVALGEMGLDYYRNYTSRYKQQEVFDKQLELANEIELPVFIHDRDSGNDVLNSLRKHRPKSCVVHCFTGSEKLLDAYLAEGYYIGITGWVCDERRGKELSLLIQRIPLNRLMIETDSPYLIPRTIEPRPKNRRNEPAYLQYIAQKVAQCYDVSVEEVINRTSDNAMHFFSLKKP